MFQGAVGQTTPVEGAFPAQFSLDILEPPPPQAPNGSRSGEQLAVGFFVALDPSGAPFELGLGSSPDFPPWLLGGSGSHILFFTPGGVPRESEWGTVLELGLPPGFQLLEPQSTVEEGEDGEVEEYESMPAVRLLPPLEELYRSHGSAVLRRVLQDVFASLVQRPEQFAGLSSPMTFLYSMTPHAQRSGACTAIAHRHGCRTSITQDEIAVTMGCSRQWVGKLLARLKDPENGRPSNLPARRLPGLDPRGRSARASSCRATCRWRRCARTPPGSGISCALRSGPMQRSARVCAPATLWTSRS